MKKCETCNIEFSDENNYCTKCGHPLVSFNVCQRCGHPVSEEDTFCAKCGYKIEKEYHCPKCDVAIEETTKFCPDCGAKISKPVVKIAAPKKQFKQPVAGKAKAVAADGEASEPAQNPLFNKIMYFVLGGISLVLLLLMFVGCFGDLVVVKSSGYSAVTGLNISYFFGDGITNISNVFSKAQNPAAYIPVVLMFSLEYIVWALALIFITIGLIVSIIKFIKGAIHKEFNFSPKVLVRTALLSLPYPLIFAMEYGFKETAYGGGYSDTMSYTLGWGTGMILACAISIVVIVALYKVLIPIVSKNKWGIIKHAILSSLIIGLFICFVIGVGQGVSIGYSQSGYGVKGYITPYMAHMNVINYRIQVPASYSSSLPASWATSFVPTFLMMIAIFFSLFMFAKLINGKGKVGFYIFAGFTLVFIIAALSSGVSTLKAMAADSPNVVGVSAEYLKFSTVGIFTIIFMVFAMVAVGVSKVFDKKGAN